MRPIAIRRSLLVAAAVSALAGAPAGARERFAIHGEHVDAPYIQPFYDEGGPVLVDGGVAYVDEPAKRAHVVFRPPGGPPRRLGQFEAVLSPAPPKDLAGYLELDGDGKRLVLARNDDDPRFGGKRGSGAVVAATLDGEGAQTLMRCGDGLSWGPQLDGSAIMFLTPPRDNCQGSYRYRVHDLVSGKRRALPTSESASDPKIGGRYAIWDDQVYEDGEDVNRGIVYDWRGRDAVQISRKFDPFEIGADGTLVASRFSNAYCVRLVTYDVRDPNPRTLPYRTCLPYLTQLAGRRFVFIGRPPGAGPFSGRELLMLGDTSGSPAVQLTEEIPLRYYDFDGKRIAYGFYRCSGARVLAVDEVATAAEKGPMRLGPCKADIDAPDRPVNLRKGFDATVTCPNGCAGRLSVRGPNRRWRLRSDPASPFKRGRHVLHLKAPKAPAGGDATDPATLSFEVWQPNGLTTTYKRAIVIRRPGG